MNFGINLDELGSITQPFPGSVSVLVTRSGRILMVASGNRGIGFLASNVQLSQAENGLYDAKSLYSWLMPSLSKLEGNFWSAQNPKDMVMGVLLEGCE